MSKKAEYIETRDKVLECFDELKELIQDDTPLRGENRKLFMGKFINLDRTLIDNLDKASHEYSKELDEEK